MSHATVLEPVGPVSPAPRRRWRVLRRAVAVLVTMAVLAGLAFGVLLALTPGVGDAPARVARLAATENAPLLSGALPQRVVEALVATEDSRFYQHSGVDLQGAVRGTFGPLVGSGDQGGATLDQQLAKNLYTGGRRSVPDQFEQVALALKLDHHFSKAEILRLYLDTVYFGHGFYGITAAARGYFDREPGSLTWTQASMIAGLVQAPTAYDPLTHLAAARTRQRHVLDRLVATGHLTAAQERTVLAEPLGLT